jgi:hypothetical protein
MIFNLRLSEEILNDNKCLPDLWPLQIKTG